MSVIDAATNSVTATIPVGDQPLGVAVTPDGTRAYVTNTFSDTVSVIDTATNTVTATIAVGDTPRGVAVADVEVAGNAAPVAVADAYSVIGGATLSVPTPGVLANDSDADGDVLTADLVSAPTRGTLMLNPNGSFTYTPSEDTVGTDSFTYRAFDGTAFSNTVTVTITVKAGCEGQAATQVGTPGHDVLGGSGGDDVILALGGNDVIDSGSGKDIICAGSGNDHIETGSGNDLLHGGSGDDRLDGGSGNDQLFGEAGIDRLFGGGDNDTLNGGSGSPDLCDGEGGSDTATATCETTKDL